MKRIINGRLYDTDNCTEVYARSVAREDPVTGALVEYRETLYREVRLKPGETVDAAYIREGYCSRWDKDKVDLRRGEFLLVTRRDYSDSAASLVVVDEGRARAWMEANDPDGIERYEKYFGPCRGQFDAAEGCATETISRLRDKVSSLEYDVKSERRRVDERDAELKARDEKIESLRRQLAEMEAGL